MWRMAWLSELRLLVEDTFASWRRLLPLLLAIQVIGWVTFRAALISAIPLIPVSPWLGIAFLCLGIVAELAAAIVIMRMVGDDIGTGQIAVEMSDETESSPGLTRILAITLLPMLAIYAAMGHVNEAAKELNAFSFAVYGQLGDNLLLATSTVTNPNNLRTIIIILAVTFVMRRILDRLHEKLGWGFLGLSVTFTESFFLVVFFLTAARLLGDLRLWFTDRAFFGWIATARDGLATSLQSLQIDFPDFLSWWTPLWEDSLWPALVKATTEPVVWLAVASLVFGSRVVSIAELWRKGQPLSSVVPGARDLHISKRIAARRAEKRTPTRIGRAGEGIAGFLEETFLGDFQDKYLPTWQSIKLILRAGLPFLAAFYLAYNLLAIVHDVLPSLMAQVIGSHDAEFWLVVLPVVELVADLLIEPLRLTLLAVAFHRALQLFHARAHSSAGVESAEGTGRHRVGSLWRKVRFSVATVLVAIMLSTAGYLGSDAASLEYSDRHQSVGGGFAPLVNGSAVSVTQVEYTRALTDERVAYRTNNTYVVATIRMRVDRYQPQVFFDLTDGTRMYRAHSSAPVTAPARADSTFQVFFEVPTDAIADLELTVRTFGSIDVYNPRVIIPLHDPAKDPTEEYEARSKRTVTIDPVQYPEGR